MDYLASLLFTMVLIVGFIIYIGLINLRDQYRNRENLRKGLETVARLKNVFVLTQQHRGLTNGYLNGDLQLKAQISDVTSDIQSIYSHLARDSSWIEGETKLEKLNKRWSQIASGFESQSASSNFEEHCQLIKQILYCIDDCAEYYTLYELKDSRQKSIRYLWQDLLIRAESIGQLRAIGTGVAAAGECSSVNKIRLHYLQDTIRKMGVSGGDKSSMNKLLNTVQNEIAVDVPKVNAKEFFQQATLTLETSIEEFDRAFENIYKSKQFKS